jgi:hypothetical protein
MKKLGMAALGITAAVAMGVSSASAGDNLVSVKAAKHKGGPYTDETQGLNVPVGKRKTVYYQVKNIGDDLKLELNFDDAQTNASNTDYKVKWFKRKTNITADVAGAGYEFTLKAGKKKLFKAKVKHVAGDSNLCLGGEATGPLTFPDAAYFNVNGVCV